MKLELSNSQQKYVKNLIGMDVKEVELIDDSHHHYSWVYVYNYDKNERYEIKLLKSPVHIDQRSRFY